MQSSRSKRDPRTPYEVRIMTWRWIRQQIPRDFHQTVDALKAQDAAFRQAYHALEQLSEADMPQWEKLERMKTQARVMMRRVQAWRDDAC